MSDSMDRREFLKQTAVAGLGLSLAACAQNVKKGVAPAIMTGHKKFGPNETINLAIVGVNSRGVAHIDSMVDLPGVKITHICDVDSRALGAAVKRIQDKTGQAPQGIKDIRKLLALKDVDAITIATPDHWHTPMSIMALAAGKHVYCEKPATQNPYEGEMVREAVRKYNGVFQMGNQRRSYPNVIKAIEAIHNGSLIGNAYCARAWYSNSRAPIGFGKTTPVPAWLGEDGYDLWQGPAPRKPYKDNLIHYNWHWFWHWGTGEALNNGTHEVDVCRWALGVNYPTRVVSTGGRYHYVKQDDWETPDTQIISWDFPEGKGLTWENRSCNQVPTDGIERGVMIYGTDGGVLINGDSYTVYDLKGKLREKVSGRKQDATNKVSTDLPGDQAHFKNFLDGIRGEATLHSPVEEGVKSCHLLHLGNIAWRTNRLLEIDTANGRIKDGGEAMKLWQRQYEKGWEPMQYL